MGRPAPKPCCAVQDRHGTRSRHPHTKAVPATASWKSRTSSAAAATGRRSRSCTAGYGVASSRKAPRARRLSGPASGVAHRSQPPRDGSAVAQRRRTWRRSRRRRRTIADPKDWRRHRNVRRDRPSSLRNSRSRHSPRLNGSCEGSRDSVAGRSATAAMPAPRCLPKCCGGSGSSDQSVGQSEADMPPAIMVWNAEPADVRIGRSAVAGDRSVVSPSRLLNAGR